MNYLSDDLREMISQNHQVAFHPDTIRVMREIIGKGDPWKIVEEAQRVNKKVDKWRLYKDIGLQLANTYSNDRGPQGGGIALMSFSSIAEKRFEPMHWNIEKILPAGTMLLFGKPKKGKSYLTLMMGICVAAGREVFGKQTSGKRVIYLGLEDSQRRMQRRGLGCAKTLGIEVDDFGENLLISTTSKTIDKGLMDELQQMMDEHPDTGLIVVDMLKKVTGESSKKDLYQEQARVGDALSKFCHDYPDLSIIVVHHSRKAESDDPFDLVSGTTGLSGSYDSLAAIADTEGTRVLHITGRDLESVEIPLLMDDKGMYTLEEASASSSEFMSSTRRTVFNAIPNTELVTRKEIISGCKLPSTTVDQQLRKLVKAGLVKHADHGTYQKTGERFYE